MCLRRRVLHIGKRLLHTDSSPSLRLFTDTMTMTMARLTSYWIVALKSISRLLSALLKRLPKGCTIASGGSSSTLRRFVLVVAGLPVIRSAYYSPSHSRVALQPLPHLESLNIIPDRTSVSGTH